MKCLILDDEPLAIELLQSHIGRIDSLFVVKTCTNAIEALNYLRHNTVDLLFLDIQMPKITGIDLLRSLSNKPKVILTTAYRDYAFEAFDLDVVDYLLKPISFDRFLRAVSKASGTIYANPLSGTDYQLVHYFDDAYIYLREEREMVKVFLKDIHYIESLRDYIRVKVANQQIISYNKIGYLEKKLPENKFIRVHRSFIVALDRISSFTPVSVKLDGFDIPLGRKYKNETMKALHRSNILQSG